MMLSQSLTSKRLRLANMRRLDSNCSSIDVCLSTLLLSTASVVEQPDDMESVVSRRFFGGVGTPWHTQHFIS